MAHIVSDRYRWLEDLDSAETKAWIESQNERTFRFLETVPQRETIRRRLTEITNYEKCGVPFKEGGRAFFLKNDGLQNQSVVYALDSPGAAPRVLLDPNTLSADGTAAVMSMHASFDGRLLAYSLAVSGSDWQEWKVLDATTGEHLSDHLKWSKFSGAAWTPG